MTAETGIRPVDGESRGIKEVVLHPGQLMERDLAYSVIDPGSTLIGGKFLPDHYDVAWAEVLRVWDPRIKAPRLRTKNGHHRVAQAAEYMADHTDYVLMGNDVTGITLKHNYPRQEENYLTEAQFYKEIGQATKAHGEIQFRRMASHLISDWRGMVGDEEIAAQFTGLAALRTLGRSDYAMQSLDEAFIHQSIDDSGLVIMGADDTKVRNQLKLGLKSMSSRILATGMGYARIAFGGFQLVTAGFEDIGVEARESEIRGLVALHEVDSKFSRQNRQRQQDEMGDYLVGAFRSITAPVGEKEKDIRGDEVRSIMNVLAEPKLTYSESLYILDTSQDGTLTSRLEEVEERNRKSSRRGSASGGRPAGQDKRQGQGEQRTGPQPAEQMGSDAVVIATANELTEALREYPKDGSLSVEAQGAVMGVVEQAKRLGLVTADAESVLPDSDKDVPEVRSDVDIAREMLVFLGRTEFAPDALPFIAESKLRLVGLEVIDLSKIILQPEVGKARWFKDKFILKRTELRPDDRRQMTKLVHSIASRHLTELGSAWDSISGTIRDRDGLTGLRAIDASFSNRIAYLASQVNWDFSSDEFRFLCANHYQLSVQSFIREARAAGGEVTIEKFKNLQELEALQRSFGNDLNVSLRGVPANRVDAYKELLQYAVYSPIKSTQFSDAAGYLRRNSFSSGVSERLRETKEQSGYQNVLDLFDEAIIRPQEKA